MFTTVVEEGLVLALDQPSFASQYLQIVINEANYLNKWLTRLPSDDLSFFTTFIRCSLKGYAAGESLTCAIILKHVIVGNISFNCIDRNLGKAEMGYWLSHAHQGKGIVTKAATQLIRIAFEEMAMTKIEICTAVDNIPSRHVCDRLGFSFETIITQAENINGRIVDHAVYGLDKQKWLERTTQITFLAHK